MTIWYLLCWLLLKYFIQNSVGSNFHFYFNSPQMFTSKIKSANRMICWQWAQPRAQPSPAQPSPAQPPLPRTRAPGLRYPHSVLGCWRLFYFGSKIFDPVWPSWVRCGQLKHLSGGHDDRFTFQLSLCLNTDLCCVVCVNTLLLTAVCLQSPDLAAGCYEV